MKAGEERLKKASVKVELSGDFSPDDLDFFFQGLNPLGGSSYWRDHLLLVHNDRFCPFFAVPVCHFILLILLHLKCWTKVLLMQTWFSTFSLLINNLSPQKYQGSHLHSQFCEFRPNWQSYFAKQTTNAPKTYFFPGFRPVIRGGSHCDQCLCNLIIFSSEI